MKTIVVNAFEFGADQFGTINAHVVCLTKEEAQIILDIQKQMRSLPDSVVYVAVRGDVYPLDFIEKELEEIVGREAADEFYDGVPYIVVDGDPFDMKSGKYETDIILVYRDNIVTRYNESESESIQEAIESIAKGGQHD